MRYSPASMTARSLGAVSSLVSSLLFFAAVFAVAAGAVFATGVVASPVIGKATLPAIHGSEHRVLPDRWDDVQGDRD